MRGTASLPISAALAFAPAAPALAQKGPVHATREMPPGMAAAYVRGIQEELAAHGYRPGQVDGVSGPRTIAAIRAYQRDAGLAATGEPSKQLLDHLKVVQPRTEARS